ncbi:MAG TPA: prevent-host-death protein [Caldisericia bacterium]|nr:prevent-host-death protein [Caldisericia bacterium]
MGGVNRRSGMYNLKNAEEYLAAMDIEASARRESMLHLRESLISAEEGRLNSKKGYSIEEVSSMMREAVKNMLDGQLEKQNV